VLLPQAVAQQQLAQRHCQNQRRLSVGRCHQQAAAPVPLAAKQQTAIWLHRPAVARLVELLPQAALQAPVQPGTGEGPQLAPEWSIAAH
jgi:hypothetical protein